MSPLDSGSPFPSAMASQIDGNIADLGGAVRCLKIPTTGFFNTLPMTGSCGIITKH